MNLYTKLRCVGGRAKTKLFRKLGLLRTDWQSSLPDEVRFWRGALTDPEKNWLLAEYHERTNPTLQFQQELRELLAHHNETIVRILDVGAGPLTRIGKVWPGKSLEIIATDPLAKEYDTILDEIGVKPLVRTIAVQGEKLMQTFASSSFDLVYASNSLDHALDPVSIIKQMCSLVKSTGRVYLWHFVNVAIGERYKGLHQWNFSCNDDDMLIDDGRRYISLKEELGPSWVVNSRIIHEFGSDVVITSIYPS